MFSLWNMLFKPPNHVIWKLLESLVWQCLDVIVRSPLFCTHNLKLVQTKDPTILYKIRVVQTHTFHWLGHYNYGNFETTSTSPEGETQTPLEGSL